jgi:hypothetical protein
VRSVVWYHPDSAQHGFQYVDWQFDGEDLIRLCARVWCKNSAEPVNKGFSANNGGGQILGLSRPTKAVFVPLGWPFLRFPCSQNVPALDANEPHPVNRERPYASYVFCCPVGIRARVDSEWVYAQHNGFGRFRTVVPVEFLRHSTH